MGKWLLLNLPGIWGASKKQKAPQNKLKGS